MFLIWGMLARPLRCGVLSVEKSIPSSSDLFNCTGNLGFLAFIALSLYICIENFQLVRAA